MLKFLSCKSLIWFGVDRLFWDLGVIIPEDWISLPWPPEERDDSPAWGLKFRMSWMLPVTRWIISLVESGGLGLSEIPTPLVFVSPEFPVPLLGCRLMFNL